MNKQTYYLLGGALLASTALTSGAHAANIRNGGTGNGESVATSFTAAPLAAQVFSPTTTVANTAVLGTGGTSTSASTSLIVDFTAALTTTFGVQLNVTNAAFTGTQTVVLYHQTSSGSLEVNVSNGCSIQTLPDKIYITNCAPAAASSADAMAIIGVQYTSAAALATAGTSISISGFVNNNGATTFENITSANVVTSKNAAETSIKGNSSVNIDNGATPVFSSFSSGATSATLGSIHFSATNAVASDLVSTISAMVSLTGTAEVKVFSSALSDPALKSISVDGQKATAAQFVSGSVSFQVAAGSLNDADIIVVFDGTTGILATVGTSTASVTPTTVAESIQSAIPAFSGSLGSLTRGGLSVELNTVYATAGEGSTKYRAIIRIANQGVADGPAIITVKNDATGALIGSYQTTTVKAGGTLQITAADIEANVSGAAASGANYKVIVSGSFPGYVQNMIWNSVTGIFTDISGFRNGTSSLDP